MEYFRLSLFKDDLITTFLGKGERAMETVTEYELSLLLIHHASVHVPDQSQGSGAQSKAFGNGRDSAAEPSSDVSRRVH